MNPIQKAIELQKDEFEKNIRKLLNYGHTFGHALEGYTNHKIPHGVGVLIGMDIANYVSVKRKLLTLPEFNDIHVIIKSYFVGFKVEIKDYNLYMDFLSHDKKVIGNEVSAILCKGVGKIEIVKTKLDQRLKKEIKEYFDKIYISR